ncbi:MAG: ATP-binding protein, partial [Bacteroidota bacterium]|nr:ATP-binding protein [Bacteroidota bacterium]
LLLSKIENRQFVEQTEIDLCALIIKKLEFLEELFALKQIKITTRFFSEVKTIINPMLADILINNLLSNALKHNIKKGEIRISSRDREITIQNTGKAPTIDLTKVFQRFAKQGDSTESTGLGLAIANEICKSYGFTLTYYFKNDLHTIEFKS